MTNHLLIRKASTADHPFLREVLYASIHIQSGEEKPPFAIIDTPEIAKYLAGWMKASDTGVIAEVAGEKAGAAWTRVFSSAATGGYGFIDPAVPELCFAVMERYRGNGVGTALMEQLFADLQEKGFKRLSLSVDKTNRAVNLYRKLGFKQYKEQETDLLMIKDFSCGHNRSDGHG